ncbi:hypothetical protein RI129_010694 [Pyrocoelia pectoralis]|uniref:Non-structural maintenance of chromosomes element 1 homolog n=1 Tax=Pyrocoelia pectoralis TaxID=417401 RepID=A0AAN7V3T6_9COLE
MYNDDHRYFLQFMLENSYISIERALEFCNKHSIENAKDRNELKQFITVINDKISKQDLKINFLKCEVTGEDKLALLNTANDDICKLQNIFQPHELEYFQLVLNRLIEAEDHQIKKMECYNLNTTTKRITVDTIEKLLITWTAQGYLVENGSYLCLGARCVAEFAPYFNVHCKDYYSNCFLCSEIQIMHKHCMEKYLNKHERCPSCKRTWNAPQSQQVNGNESSSDESENHTIRMSGKRRRVL